MCKHEGRGKSRQSATVRQEMMAEMRESGGDLILTDISISQVEGGGWQMQPEGRREAMLWHIGEPWNGGEIS